MRACNTEQLPRRHRDPESRLRARLPVDEAAERLDRFLTATVELMRVLARACGHSHLSHFALDDLIDVRSRHGRADRHHLRGSRSDDRSSPSGTRSPSPTNWTTDGCKTVTADRRTLALMPLRRALRRARQPLPAPGRPARRGRRSRRAGCAARGTATTTTRSPARRRRALGRRRATFPVEVRDDGVYVELPVGTAAASAPSPT